MKVLMKFLDIIDYINEWVGRIFGFVLVSLMLGVVYAVAMRYVFNRPVIWAMEVNRWSLLVAICLGCGYTLLHDAHVKVSVVYDLLTPRGKAILDLISHTAVFLICIVLVWHGGKITWDNLVNGYRSNSVWAPILWPSKALVPIAGVLLGLQCLARWIRDWFMAVKGMQLESKAYRGDGGFRG
jgi:TRAP-type mannitol/chloroaromatic compound transport system permease small subunit